MKRLYLIFFILLLSTINCHISIVAKLIKNEKYKLKGTFTINSAIIKNSYLSVIEEKVVFSKSKQKFDIIEFKNDSYYIISRHTKCFIGVNKNNTKKLSLYKTFKKSIQDYITWKIEAHNSTFTKSNITYTIKNKYNNKNLYLKNNKTLLESLPEKQISYRFQFRILKLYQEEENIKESNYEKVEKEPIDLFIKYIDLNDKNLTREGIKQIYKDYDAEELRYSLRSILQYIPWIRKIFIVMPNEKVRFLKPYNEIKDKFVYVNDKEFLGYDSANIFAFSFNLHKMEKFGMSKNFIYMEDDYFIGKPLKKTDFFYYDEKEKKVFPFVIANRYTELNPILRLRLYKYLYKKKEKIKVHGHRGWVFSVFGTDKFFIEKYGNKTMNIINPDFTHNARAENIDDMKEIFKEIQDYKYINETLYSKTRHLMTLNQPHFVNLYQLNIKKRKVNPISNRYLNMENSKLHHLYVPLFVLNTCGDNIPTTKDYLHLSYIMKTRFPNPTKYEIENDTQMVDINKIEENIELLNKNNSNEIGYNKDNNTNDNTEDININKNNNKDKIAKDKKNKDNNNKDNDNKDNNNKDNKNEYNNKSNNDEDNNNVDNINKNNKNENNNKNNEDNNDINKDNNNDNNKKEKILKKNMVNIGRRPKQFMRLNIDYKENDKDNDNENNKVDEILKNYSFHGYILLNILLCIIIFSKIKNIYEYDY